jgi:putative flippase GtrA
MVSVRTLRTLFRYVLTGGTAAIVDLSVFVGLHRLGVPIALAASASFCVAAVVNYTLTSIFVFKTPLSPKGFVLFFGVALLGMSINVGVTVAGSAFTPFGPILSKVAGIGVAFLFNFWLNSTFVFKAPGVGASSPQ